VLQGKPMHTSGIAVWIEMVAVGAGVIVTTAGANAFIAACEGNWSAESYGWPDL